NSLQRCIPFINFYNLTSEEFSDNVLPYKKILPKELYKDLLKNYLKPNNQSIKDTEIDSKNIDSKIITSQHAELILKWINMKSSNSSNAFTTIFSKFIYIDIKEKDTSSFKLLLRGTRDGFNSEKFHEICDNQSHTVTIIKVKDSNEILGGYNPIAWRSDNSLGNTKNSFVFSFKDNNNIENHILSRVEVGRRAIYNSYFSCSNFGINDLTLCDGMGSCYQQYYEKPIRGVADEKLLVKLIQNDNLQMSEIQVWEHMIKWGHAQNLGLPSEPTNFSKEDFDTLKNSLQRCIPFINFYNLTSEEFYDNVLPYKNILPNELYKDLLKNYLKTNNQPIKKSEPNIIKGVENAYEINPKNIDSKIITSQHAELILKWTNLNSSNSSNASFTSIFSKFIYNDIKDKNTTSSFKLLLRGTRDGFAPRKFHEICDNQSHTVTIIKVRDGNEILGGYNPIAWKSKDDYSYTKESFIFSFKDNNNIENHILSRVNYENLAIKNSSSSCSSFGFSDLILLDGRGHCKELSYEKPIRRTADYFLVEEYEVFQIV
ncbi:hypothetical protein RhiirA1_475575, partial [Rhizophagus irregularis]